MLMPTNDLIDLKLHHQFSLHIVGPTGVGKTDLLLKIIANRDSIIDTKIVNVYFIYAIDQIKFHNFKLQHPEVNFVCGLPKNYDKFNSLFVFDDFQSELSSSLKKFFTDFIIRECHHSSVSVCFTTQNLYIPALRTIALNTTYLVFFNQIRDQTTVKILGRQLFSKHKNFLEEAYEYCTQNPRGYIFIDMHVLQNSKFRVRSSIFKEEDLCVFVPK